MATPNESLPKDLVFFNYHEFLIPASRQDQPTQLQTTHHAQGTAAPSLVATHFPNPYTTKGSDLYKRTRIVRVPRVYDLNAQLFIHPQFSTYYPGKEPAALQAKNGHFSPQAQYLGQVFGVSSATPISAWIPEYEFSEIVTSVNKLLLPSHMWLENIVDFLTASLYSLLWTKLVWRSCLEASVAAVERYLETVNARLSTRHPDLKVISPARSGLLLLDIQIPRPELHEASTLLDTDFPTPLTGVFKPTDSISTYSPVANDLP